jgi:ribosomal protein S18 acetylase RimI-like enzyme
MNTVKVRKAGIGDAQDIALIHTRTWQYAYRGQLPDSFLDNISVEKRLNMWTETLANSESLTKVFVATDEDEVIGFCAVCPCRDSDLGKEFGELAGIYVDQHHMGKGAGTKLLERGLSELKNMGYTKATLWVLASNAKTINWYESHGWRIEGKTKVDKRDAFEMNETRYITDLK